MMSIELKKSKWEIEPPNLESPREHLINTLGSPTSTSEDRAIWVKKHYAGLYAERHTHRNESPLLETELLGHNALYILFIIAAIHLISTVISGRPTIGLTVFWSGILYFFYVPNHPSILFEIGELESRTVSSIFSTFLFVGFALSWITGRIHYPFYPIDEFSLLILPMLLLFTYSLGHLPFSSSNPSTATLTIPAIIIQRVLFTLILFSAVAFIGAYYLIQVDALFDYAASAESLNESTKDLLDNQARQAATLKIAKFGAQVIAFAFFLIPIYFIGEMVQSRRLLRLLYNTKPKPFSLTLQRNSFLLIYLFSTVMIILLLVPIISILAYGFIGYLPFPGTEIYTQRFVSEPIQFNQTTYSLNGTVNEPLLNQPRQINSSHIIERSYEATDRIAAYIPLPIPDRTISIAIFGVLLIPTLSFLLTWMVGLPKGVINKFRVIRTGTHIDHDSSEVPDNITVLEINDEYGVIVRPISLFFGLKQYILIGESAHKELDTEDQLDAVLAHEVYHIQNRDLQVGAVSQLLSFCFGGKNAILAFYDYPKIEREADEYAAKNVGKKPTKIAIDKLDIVSRKLNGGEISNASPGMLSTKRAEKYSTKMSDLLISGDSEKLTSRLSSMREVLESYTNAPENLLHKDVLVQSSHTDAETRIQRIEELDI